jgi:hypothetical protein
LIVDEFAKIGALLIAIAEKRMYACQRLDTAAKIRSEDSWLGCAGKRALSNRLHDGKRIFDSVVQLVHQQSLRILSALAFEQVGCLPSKHV